MKAGSSDGPTVLFLVRHGESDSNAAGRIGGHSPVPLTERGLRQAALTGRALAAVRPTAVISSDLLRAHQTAAAIAEVTGHPLELDPGLRERSLGVLDGLSYAEAQIRHPEAWKALQARVESVPEGGESTDSVYARVSATVDRLLERHVGGRVVVVTHGLALFHAFSHVCGLGSPSGHRRVFMLVDNCSITHLEHRRDDDRSDRWRILRMNDVGHLRGLDDTSMDGLPPHAAG